VDSPLIKNEAAVRSHSKTMAKFYIRDTFEIPTRNLFVLAGSVTEGEIEPGMLVHVPINSQLVVVAPVHSVEFARREGTEEVCLCITDGPEVEMLRGLTITDELCEVAPRDEGVGNAI
jgi:hypothetical protein